MSSSDQTVAFIGLGNMGAPMVANLCSKGFAVRAYDVAVDA
ncbi:MAG: NAD(P)-binding domain-containing protein, partial [Pseudomonadota bacterium]|nr:NAD(P)-binding domain-containing protein [Pseudomonadota bacterium]